MSIDSHVNILVTPTWLRVVVTSEYSVNIHPADASNSRGRATDSQKKAAHIA